MVKHCDPHCLAADIRDGYCLACGRVQLKPRDTSVVGLAIVLKTLIECRVSSAEFHPDGSLSVVVFLGPDPPEPEKVEPPGSGFTDEVDGALGLLANRGKKPA